VALLDPIFLFALYSIDDVEYTTNFKKKEEGDV
jgi:hypothetical protein